MIVGIDGNMWYCSNGICLGDPASKYAFADTLRDSVKLYQKDFHSTDWPEAIYSKFMDLTVAEYKTLNGGW